MPIQHVSPRVLKAMGRPGISPLPVISRLREAMPDIAIRTTLMTGFPGETEVDFSEMMDFVSSFAIERLGVFAFSREEGTKAHDMPRQVAGSVAKGRAESLLSAQAKISHGLNEKLIGKTLKTLITDKQDGIYIGRTYRDAPGADGVVRVKTDAPLEIGAFIDAEITGCDDYDLYASHKGGVF